MAKMGRPKKEVIKDRYVNTRMTQEEYQRFKEYSESHQRAMSESVKEGIKLLYALGK